MTHGQALVAVFALLALAAIIARKYLNPGEHFVVSQAALVAAKLV
jgi:hypothetical protein